MRIASSTPVSSTPWTTRSAKRPSVDFRLTNQGYNRGDGANQRLVPVAVLFPVRPIEHRGSGGVVCHPRARARASPRGAPRRSLRPEPPHAAAAPATARPSRGDSSARRRGRGAVSPRARDVPDRLDLRSRSALSRALDRCNGDGDVPGCKPVRLEDDDVVRGLTPGQLAGDDLV